MTRTMVTLPDNLHRAVKHLAIERKTSLTKLVTEALEVLCAEDATDLEIGNRRLRSLFKSPGQAVSYSEYRSKRLKRK